MKGIVATLILEVVWAVLEYLSNGAPCWLNFAMVSELLFCFFSLLGLVCRVPRWLSGTSCIFNKSSTQKKGFGEPTFNLNQHSDKCQTGICTSRPLPPQTTPQRLWLDDCHYICGCLSKLYNLSQIISGSLCLCSALFPSSKRRRRYFCYSAYSSVKHHPHLPPPAEYAGKIDRSL